MTLFRRTAAGQYGTVGALRSGLVSQRCAESLGPLKGHFVVEVGMDAFAFDRHFDQMADLVRLPVIGAGRG